MSNTVDEISKASQHSTACCSVPPVIAEKEYKAKGTYETIDGRKTYVIGSASATTGIIFCHDIFGFYPQTLQGADILASTPANYRVYIPDFFDGEPATKSWYPPTEETGPLLGAWFKRRGDFPAGAENTLKFLDEVKKQQPQITKWVGYGTCWGGKIISLTSGDNTPWAVSVQVHSAGVSADDAAKIKIPHMMLASKDEKPEDIAAFEKSLTGQVKYVETFSTQIHGWMAARSNLDDPEVVKEYERGYKTILKFLHENL